MTRTMLHGHPGDAGSGEGVLIFQPFPQRAEEMDKERVGIEWAISIAPVNMHALFYIIFFKKERKEKYHD